MGTINIKPMSGYFPLYYSIAINIHEFMYQSGTFLSSPFSNGWNWDSEVLSDWSKAYTDR